MITEIATAWSTAPVSGVQHISDTMAVVMMEPALGGPLRLVVSHGRFIFASVGTEKVSSGQGELDAPSDMDTGLPLAEQAGILMEHAFGAKAQMRWTLLQDIAMIRAQRAGWVGDDATWMTKSRAGGEVFLNSDSGRSTPNLHVCAKGDNLFQGTRVPYGRHDAPRLGPTYIGLRVVEDSHHARMDRLYTCRTRGLELGIDVESYIEAPLN